jgi:hypothetical protein
MMLRILACTLAVCASVCATPVFHSGDILWATQQNAKLYDLASSGNQALTPVFANLGGSQYGQITFSADLTAAYLTSFSTNSVFRVTADGQVSTFATGITSATGIIRTSGGQLLVGDWNDGRIYDITAGGNFAAATPWATGLTHTRNFLETATGILVVDQGAGKIVNIGSGGNLSGVTPLAYGLNDPTDIAAYNGKLYVSGGSNQVIDVTAGGNMAGKAAFAYGRSFFGLTIANNRLLAATDWTVDPGEIYDISAGGNFASASKWARNLPGQVDTLFETVPDAVAVQATATPEPSAGLMLVVGVVAMSMGRFRRQ